MSRIHVDNIFDKEGSGAPTLPAGAVVTGVCTATTFSGTATEASAAASGSALETSINSKASTGKSIAMSMVFG
tara:strand:- start:2883 stop:3101 length:219 start_codon:yes stop_codon:yes gene_type:complete